MRRSLRRSARYLIAPVLMVLAGLAVLAYILAHEPAFTAPSWLRSQASEPYVFRAAFTSAPAIVAGQGQTVDIAGVPVGDVKSVGLQDGRAVLELEIERRYAPIYRDATVLLRPRTPLKDMYLALDPGTATAGALPEHATLPTSQTQPDVNYDEILANLDTDARQYLRVILAAAGQGLRDPSNAPGGDGRPSARAVADLRGSLKGIAPLAHDTRRLTAGLARRRRALARVVTRFEQIATAVGGVDRQLADLVDVANRTFRATATRDTALRAALTRLPATLRQTDTALQGVGAGTAQLQPALTKLAPFATALGPALAAGRPFARTTTPVLRDQLRPFARATQPVARALQPAAGALNATLGPLGDTLRFTNAFFNAAAYNPAGPEEGYLFWGAWLSHIGPSLLTAQDAHGAVPRAVLLATCAQLDALHQVELGNPSLGPILRLLNTADRATYCGAGAAG